MGKVKSLIDKAKANKKTTIIILVGIAVFIFIIVGAVRGNIAQKKAEANQGDTPIVNTPVTSTPQGSSADSLLLKMQDELTKTYGVVQDGYIWNVDGTIMSLGDKSMSAEEVLYGYLNGIRSLDFSSAQKYSRDSRVVNTYGGYFSTANTSTNYYDNFIRNMYRLCLLSMQIEGIENTSVFAENKQVFTVNVSMLDLTQKEFWQEDKAEIYKNLRIYGSDQNDDTKSEIYLYDYINRYYESSEAARRTVRFDITLQKYPDLDTGWLVCIDTDVDSACKYADGTLVVNYIRQLYGSEGYTFLKNLEEGNSVSSNTSKEDSNPEESGTSSSESATSSVVSDVGRVDNSFEH